jgi:sigma-B regulation protein RsbU (phosphoserine phosphatase)
MRASAHAAVARQPGEMKVPLQRVIDSLDDGVVVSDLEGRCLLSNPAARRLFATDFADVPAAEWASVFGCLLPDMVTPYPPQDMPLTRALRGEVVSDLELFMVNLWAPQGMWLSVNGTPLRDARGTIEGGVVILRDTTRIKRKVQQIELLSNVVEATADAVIVTDRAGRIEYVNPAFETATGYSRAEVLGRNPSLLKSGAHPGEFYARLWRTLVEGQVFREMFINRKKSGELFFTEQTITPIRKPGGGITHVVSVGKDVTELRRAAARESTLLLARSVQQRLFPSSPPSVPGFDIYGATFVADVTGGDYYDFIPLPGECLGVLVADVSGHGVDSALLMAETRAVLRATAQTTSTLGEILAIVNRVLHADTEAHRFATLLLVSLHVPSRSLAYASAGHTPGYLLDGRGAVKAELPATGLPLGLFPDSPYETRSPPRMEEGDTLVLLTDGVTDCGTPEGELFGAGRALELVRSSLLGRSSDIVDGLYRAVRAFEEGGPQRDDVTTVVVKRLPRA